MGYYKTVFITIVISAFITGIYLWISSGDRYLMQHGIKVAGTINQTGGKNVTVAFEFLDEKYNVIVGQSNNTLQDGEAFTVLINKNDPTDCIVNFSDPVFDKSKYEIVKTLDIKKLMLSNKIAFKYKFGVKTYERLQAISSNLNLENLKERSVLFVNKKDPRISYVVFN